MFVVEAAVWPRVDAITSALTASSCVFSCRTCAIWLVGPDFWRSGLYCKAVDV